MAKLHQFLAYATIFLLVATMSACTSNEGGNGGHTNGDSISLSIDTTAIDSSVVIVEPEVDTSAKALEGMKKAVEEVDKKMEVSPCTDVQKKQIASWKKEISELKTFLAEADEDEKEGMQTAIQELQERISEYVVRYKCPQ